MLSFFRNIWRKSVVKDAKSGWPMSGLFNDPRVWGERATDMRKLAQGTRDSATQRTMLEVAHAYDKLAGRGEKRLAELPSSE